MEGVVEAERSILELPRNPIHPEPSDDLIREAHAAAYRSARRITRHGPMSEDIAQEACVRMAAHYLRIRDGHAHWTSRVATNLAIGEMRKRSTRAKLIAGVEREPEAQRDVEQHLDLLHAISRLPSKQREVILLRYFADMSYADVAQTMGCSIGSVSQHSGRALKTLRSRLGEDYLGSRDLEEDGDE